LSPLRRYATTLLLAFGVACFAVVPAVADPPQIAEKQAEVEHVLAEIDSLDVSLDKAVEAYNASTSKLQGIEHQQSVNRFELKIARRNLSREQSALARRLVAIYTSDADTSTISVLLGASSLDDLVNRVDTVNNVSKQDARVIRQVKQFRVLVAQQKRELATAHTRQTEIVQQRADAQASIESQLSERKQLVASIRSEIDRLRAQERARQARLEAEARARMLAAQLAAHQRASAPSDAIAPFSTSDPGSADSTSSDSTSSASTSSDSAGVVASTPDAAVVPSSSHGNDVVAIAMQYLGTPYVWGGASPGGFDCSGLVVFAYSQLGISLPHYTGALWNVGTPVSSDQLEPGDLVFFYGLGHVGIYIGGGQFIHAPHTGDVVKISSLSDGGYASSYDGARRIL
jgi:peptidoglycan DL-endopeptidase CwlO